MNITVTSTNESTYKVNFEFMYLDILWAIYFHFSWGCVRLHVPQLMCSKFSTLIIHAHSIVNFLRQSVT
jgi:hypothetical protein